MSPTEKVIELLVEKYGVDREAVTPDATMPELGLDSLSVAELLFDVEDEFGIEIETEAAEEIHTFGDAMRVFQTYIEDQKG